MTSGAIWDSPGLPTTTSAPSTHWSRAIPLWLRRRVNSTQWEVSKSTMPRRIIEATCCVNAWKRKGHAAHFSSEVGVQFSPKFAGHKPSTLRTARGHRNLGDLSPACEDRGSSDIFNAQGTSICNRLPMVEFAYPWFFLLIPGIPLLIVWWRQGPRRGLAFPGTEALADLPPGKSRLAQRGALLLRCA